MSHTKEPWHVGGQQKCTIYDKFGQRIANSFDGVMVTQRSDVECAANARRIVACVNRLADFATEDIEDPACDITGHGALLSELMHLERQRDELLAAANATVEAFDALPPASETRMIPLHINGLMNAIAQVKGGAK